jgi:hypothetical protein
MILATMIISKTGEYYAAWSCAKIESALPSPTLLLEMYPACASYANGTNPAEVAIVLANLDGETGVNAGAALNMSFGMALWLSVVVHAIGVEIYVSSSQMSTTQETFLTITQLHLTPREAQRLRQISYQRQLEAGMRNPGSAGLTADRLGDADQWLPETKARPDSIVYSANILTPATTAHTAQEK